MNRLKIVESAGTLFKDALNGSHVARGRMKDIVENGFDTNSAALSEAITSADLNAAFTKSIVSTLQAEYAEAERVWTKIAQRRMFEDFKPQYLREFNWDKGLQVESNAGVPVVPGSLAQIPELTEYPTFGFTTSEKAQQILKHGARLPFSWESVIDDDWGFIQSIPGNMVRLALNTEESQAFGTIVGAAGPRADVISNIGTAALTLDSLKAAKQEVRSRKVNGRAVRVPKFALVVPTALEDTAREILGITQYKDIVTTGDGSREFTITPANSDVELVVADVISDIDQSANADTTWYLVPAGGSDGVRTSLFLGFLRNHERPELRQSGNTGTYLGGGVVPGLEGSLLNDDVEYRVRHVVSGGYVETAALYASTGTSGN